MKRLFVFLLSFMFLQASYSQQEEVWEQTLMELLEDDDAGEDACELNHELLSQLIAHPLELNTASYQDLEQLPFLTNVQIVDILAYLTRFGPMRSLSELKMIVSLDYRRQELMKIFTYVDDSVELPPRSYPPQLHSELTATGRVPFYERKGDRNGYLGYKYRHSLRYTLSYGKHLKAGLTAAQDAGEPFLGRYNRWGYDNYSYYLQIDKKGIVERAVIGKYRLSAGMGLVLGNSFRLGKQATIQTLGRSTATLRPHGSRSEADYFQGAAMTMALTGRGKAQKPLTLTAFASYRGVDGTMADDGTVTTLNTNGYHRTVAEIERKHNTHLTAMGGRLAFSKGGWRAGLNGVYTHLDHTLAPQTTALFRRYYARGSHFTNASVDYGYIHHSMTINGETAVCDNGALATTNTISLQPTANLSLMALWRFYSYRYTSLYGHGMGSNSTPQNENGLLVGTNWSALPHLHLQAYADYVHFPWAKYLVSKASNEWDFMLQATCQWKKWAVTARGRARLRQRDNAEKTALTENNVYRGRLSVKYKPSEAFSTKTQIDLVRSFYQQAHSGWMASEQVAVKKPTWTASATAALFHTDDYSSRVYLYERQLAYEFYSPSFYGKGARLSLLAHTNLNKHLQLTARLGYTKYFDRSTIGTGLQQIDHSAQTDLDIQLKWKL